LTIYVRRIVGKVEEQSGTFQTAILLKVAGEETGSFQVDTHGTKDNGEVLLVSIVGTLVGDALLLDQASLSANLGGNFVMGETGSREDGNLLATGNRVHRIDGRDTSGNHFLGEFLQVVSITTISKQSYNHTRE
jgi:hypothetical protein